MSVGPIEVCFAPLTRPAEIVETIADTPLPATTLRERAVEEQRVQRRLPAIMAADVAGYSRLVETDGRAPFRGCGRFGVS